MRNPGQGFGCGGDPATAFRMGFQFLLDEYNRPEAET